MFRGPFDYSIMKRAQEKGLVTINLINIRDFATDAYKAVDDHPYGGGTGMIMKVDVIDRALDAARANLRPSVIPGPLLGKGTRNPCLAGRQASSSKTGSRLEGRDDTIRTILLDPRGTPYTEKKARELSKLDHLIMICGHYEGVD